MTRIAKQLVVGGLLIGLSACSHTAVLTERTADPKPKVFQACVDTLSDVNFSVASTDPNSGLIVGDRQIAQGESSKLNVTVTDDAGGTRVVVKFIPPTNAMGGNDTAQQYVDALKTRLPGIQPVVAP